MLKQLSGFLVISSSALLLSGCLFGGKGYIHDRSEDYLHSQSDPALKLPASVKPAAMKAAFPIPEGTDFSTSKKPSLVPPVSDNAILLQQENAAEAKSKQAVKSTLGQGATGFPVLKLASVYKVSWFKVKSAFTKLKYQTIGSDQKTGVIEVMTPADDKTSSEIYQIKVTAGSKGTIVNVLTQSGDDVDSKTAKPILSQLQKTVGQ